MKETKHRNRAPVSAAVSPSRFLGRQPILDAKGNIFGHELLFRSGPTNSFAGDAEEASRDVIDQCLLLVPETAGEARFVNCTGKALTTGIVTLLPPPSTVLEILESVACDRELMDVCRQLKKKGYRFALDDFSPEEAKLPFLEIADFLKIDFRAAGPAVRQDIYGLAASTKIILLAEKVETAAEVQLARTEGCTLFQGYFFSKPIVAESRGLAQNHAAYLRLLAALARTPTDLFEIEACIVADASLCYRLLRLVNSALFALPSPVSSIQSALLLVGHDLTIKLVTVAMADLAGKTNAKALIRTALERARFCELLAPFMNESAPRLYLLGMLSLMDAILATPMSEVLESLPIDQDMKAALLGRKNPLSAALDFARCHESVDWQKYEAMQHALGISGEAASMVYVNALRCADGAGRAFPA